MDIEGFEFKAIEGMGSLIDRVDFLTCEISPTFLHECGSSVEQLLSFMLNHGFVSYCTQPLSDNTWVRGNHKYEIRQNIRPTLMRYSADRNTPIWLSTSSR